MNYSEIQAEALKKIENVGAAHAEIGNHPRPIRKRGFHRALNRGEVWALSEKAMRDAMNEQIRFINETLYDWTNYSSFFGTDRKQFYSPLMVGFKAWLPETND